MPEPLSDVEILSLRYLAHWPLSSFVPDDGDRWPVLDGLVKRGLVDYSPSTVAGLPCYAITDAGRAALESPRP